MSTRWIMSVAILMSVSLSAGVGANEPTPLPVPAELARQSGCLECHSVDQKVIGPAWRDVASSYRKQENARERLIGIVSKGGKGNWTQITRGVPMPPHSPRLSDAQISQLVDWILGLAANEK